MAGNASPLGSPGLGGSQLTTNPSTVIYRLFGKWVPESNPLAPARAAGPPSNSLWGVGNPEQWILESIQRAVELYSSASLYIRIVSYGASNPSLAKLVADVTSNIRQSDDDEVKPPRHHCPCCGCAMDAWLWYPWHFCFACVELAEDSRGRKLEFSNTSFSGGLNWRYRDGPDSGEKDCGAVICQIAGRPVLVTEARFSLSSPDQTR